MSSSPGRVPSTHTHSLTSRKSRSQQPHPSSLRPSAHSLPPQLQHETMTASNFHILFAQFFANFAQSRCHRILRSSSPVAHTCSQQYRHEMSTTTPQRHFSQNDWPRGVLRLLATLPHSNASQLATTNTSAFCGCEVVISMESDCCCSADVAWVIRLRIGMTAFTKCCQFQLGHEIARFLSIRRQAVVQVCFTVSALNAERMVHVILRLGDTSRQVARNGSDSLQ